MSAAHSDRDCGCVSQCLVVSNYSEGAEVASSPSATGPMNFGGMATHPGFSADVRNLTFAEWLKTPVALELLSRRTVEE